MIKALFVILSIFFFLQPGKADSFGRMMNNYEDSKAGIEVGYVNKQYVTKFNNGYTLHEDLFGNEGKFLHGMQIGAYAQPMTSFGLGVKTGLYWEQYFASGRNMGYDNFSEGDIYIPLDAVLRIPMTDKVSLTLIGGISMNYIVYGELSDDHYDHYYDDRDDSFIFNFIESLSQSRYDSEYLKYGSNGWPGRFNAQY